jgi:dTDP-4-amino-4,6-dideoxygalactose transaminase
MTNIQASFLYDQLNDIDNILLRKQKVFDTYDLLFDELIKKDKIQLQKVNKDTKRANWMYAIRIVNNQRNQSETFEYFKSKGIETRPFFYSYEHHNHLNDLKIHDLYDLSLCNKLSQEIIMIPSSPLITYEDQVKIVNCISEI